MDVRGGVEVSNHAGIKEMDAYVREGAVLGIVECSHEGGRAEAMKSGHRGMVKGLHGDVKFKGKTYVERVVGAWLVEGINRNLGRN